VLSVRDHLTCKEAIEFWQRYFADFTISSVHVEAFCEAVQAEFATNVFKTVFETAAAASDTWDEILQDFFVDLQNKVSIDQESVSLNALELFTRRAGLSRSIQTLLEETTSCFRAQRSIKLNDTIV